MPKFFNKFINYLLKKRMENLSEVMKRMTPKTHTTSTSKIHINATETLTISSETENILNKIDSEVRNIVKKCLFEPETILTFIKTQGTFVYKIKNADKILAKIGEEEGFLIPFKGLKALYLSFLISLNTKKLILSLKTNEMFIFKDTKISIYNLLYHFHKWYGFKKNLPGYDEKSQKLFKENFSNTSNNNLDNISIQDTMLLKDAIARDRQAADFVIQITKEFEGAKNALKKIKENGSAEI